MSASPASLAEALDAALPQTQCTRCGEPDCRRYAEAIADGRAPVNRCPPGGAEGIVRLAALTGQAIQPLDAAHGREGPRQLAIIDEAACIGCTLCIQACPVDCIVGAPKQMHTVIEPHCTGCELCVPACPVDCIALVDAVGTASAAAPTGWAAWSAAQAEAARGRYLRRGARLAAQAARAAAAAQPPAQRKAQLVEAALARARAQRGAG